MTDQLKELVSYALATFGAVLAIINSIIAEVRVRKLQLQLDAAKQRETYIECPHCKKKILLSQMSFRLPSGALDNNLDGKPDED